SRRRSGDALSIVSSDVKTVSICARALELLPCMTSSEDAARTARSGVLVAHAAKINRPRTAAVFLKRSSDQLYCAATGFEERAPVAAHCLKSGSGLEKGSTARLQP